MTQEPENIWKEYSFKERVLMGERTEKLRKLVNSEKDSLEVIAEMLDLFEEMEEERTFLQNWQDELEEKQHEIFTFGMFCFCQAAL